MTPDQVSWSANSEWFTWAVAQTLGRMPVGAGKLGTVGTEVDVSWTAVDDDGVVTFVAAGALVWLRKEDPRG